MDSIDLFIIVLTGIILLVVIAVFIFLELQYKHRLIIRDLVNNRKIIKQHKVREFTDKQGVEWWQLSGEKRKIHKNIAAPPEDAIEITTKGKKFAECYRTQNGSIIWITDKNRVLDIKEMPEPPEYTKVLPKWITEIKDKDKRKEQSDKFYAEQKAIINSSKRTHDTYEPLTANQRLVLINNIKKAEMKKGMDWKQQLVPIVSIGAFALVLMGLMIFWGDLTKPTLEANQQFIEAQSLHKETMEILLEIKTGQQKIENRLNTIESTSGEQPPN